MRKTYKGTRHDHGCIVTVNVNGIGRMLDPRLDVRNHSPTGMEWGYGGSGPAQLALALLCDALADEERAVALHQRFKWDVIASIDMDAWVMTNDMIRDWARDAERERGEI